MNAAKDTNIKIGQLRAIFEPSNDFYLILSIHPDAQQQHMYDIVILTGLDAGEYVCWPEYLVASDRLIV